MQHSKGNLNNDNSLWQNFSSDGTYSLKDARGPYNEAPQLGRSGGSCFSCSNPGQPLNIDSQQDCKARDIASDTYAWVPEGVEVLSQCQSDALRAQNEPPGAVTQYQVKGGMDLTNPDLSRTCACTVQSSHKDNSIIQTNQTYDSSTWKELKKVALNDGMVPTLDGTQSTQTVGYTSSDASCATVCGVLAGTASQETVDGLQGRLIHPPRPSDVDLFHF
jgi:hypothetical protein